MWLYYKLQDFPERFFCEKNWRTVFCMVNTADKLHFTWNALGQIASRFLSSLSGSYISGP